MSHVDRNRAAWTEYAPEYAEWAPRQWASPEITWGVWHVPESELGALPDVAGMDTIELGCGRSWNWITATGDSSRAAGKTVAPTTHSGS